MFIVVFCAVFIGAVVHLNPTGYLYFQHCRQLITEDSLREVQAAKAKLVREVVGILESLRIDYVVVDGNLLEIERGTVIPQDDDVDIRYLSDGVDKLAEYGKQLRAENKDGHPVYIDDTRGIFCGERILSREKMLKNGVQFQVHADDSIHDFKVHLDLVPASVVVAGVWEAIGGEMFQGKERKEYLGTRVRVPNQEDAHRYLAKTYGGTYMKPNSPSKLKDGIYYHA